MLIQYAPTRDASLKLLESISAASMGSSWLPPPSNPGVANPTTGRTTVSMTRMAKLNISVAKGKREFDKRNVIKDRESKISLKRIKKNFNS